MVALGALVWGSGLPCVPRFWGFGLASPDVPCVAAGLLDQGTTLLVALERLACVAYGRPLKWSCHSLLEAAWLTGFRVQV